MITSVRISRTELEAAIAQRWLKALCGNRNWFFVRVWPDGTISEGQEVSKLLPEREYFRVGNHWPVTVWSMDADGCPGPEDGVFLWEDCEEEEASFWCDAQRQESHHEKTERFCLPCRLSDTLIEPLDVSADVQKAVAALEEAGYTVED
jgi:hypothetical protein